MIWLVVAVVVGLALAAFLSAVMLSSAIDQRQEVGGGAAMTELAELSVAMDRLRGDLFRIMERYRYARDCDEIARVVEAGIAHLDAAIGQIRNAALFADWEEQRREGQE